MRAFDRTRLHRSLRWQAVQDYLDALSPLGRRVMDLVWDYTKAPHWLTERAAQRRVAELLGLELREVAAFRQGLRVKLREVDRQMELEAKARGERC